MFSPPAGAKSPFFYGPWSWTNTERLKDGKKKLATRVNIYVRK